MELEEILANINLGSLVLKNLKNKVSTNAKKHHVNQNK